jgi:hypothetical protein
MEHDMTPSEAYDLELRKQENERAERTRKEQTKCNLIASKLNNLIADTQHEKTEELREIVKKLNDNINTEKVERYEALQEEKNALTRNYNNRNNELQGQLNELSLQIQKEQMTQIPIEHRNRIVSQGQLIVLTNWNASRNQIHESGQNTQSLMMHISTLKRTHKDNETIMAALDAATNLLIEETEGPLGSFLQL